MVGRDGYVNVNVVKKLFATLAILKLVQLNLVGV